MKFLKRFFGFLSCVALAASPAAVMAQSSFTAQQGVSLFSSTNLSATAVSGAARLPTFSGTGVLTVVESGVTGSPSGCTIALAYQSNASATAGSAVATIALTPANGVQTFSVQPSTQTGDQYVATYACSSTYPTAGLISVSFSPVTTTSLDPCSTTAKSSVAISVGSATTTQLVALSAGKKVYVCGLAVSSVGGTTTFEYGTGSACATGTTTLSGAFAAASTVSLPGGGTTLFTAPSGNALCLLSGTSTSATAGVLTYVQQ